MSSRPLRAEPYRFQVTNVAAEQGRARVTLRDGLGRARTVDVAIGPMDSDDVVRQRVRDAVRAALSADTLGARQATRARALLAAGPIEIERPGRPYAALSGGKLEGHWGHDTTSFLLRLRDGHGIEREVPITPNRNGWFFVAVGDLAVVSLTPVSTHGVLGEEYTLDQVNEDD